MATIYLEAMIDNLAEGCLPANWEDFDLAAFSRSKRLWGYQQTALHQALLALWKYYEAPDWSDGERKRDYMAWYRTFGMDADLDLPLDRSSAAKRKLASLLESFYTVSENGKLGYEQFINRMGFWMATGSGKTLVIVKLIEILQGLISRKEIPAHDILVLAHRDDLLEQLRAHVADFNTAGRLFIRLRELREYDEVKRETPSLLKHQEITVFYYRSDNLSDERKEKIIDFRAYDNNGGWYILLDEAHKGDKEDSKRQHIYSILSRNGFLFNFSATFTDERDIVTTVANYNLSEFIRKGHGKHVCVLRQEVRAFRRDDDYTDSEKQKIVLKALMLLAYARQFETRVRRVRADLYHRPLLMTLVNTVNTEDADLKLFFRELVRIGKGAVDRATWQSARQELLAELCDHPSFLFESGINPCIDVTLMQAIDQTSVIRDIFNAPGPGEIEVLVRPSDRQEVAFKLKTSDDAFALIRIGDITHLFKEELEGYEINQHFSNEGFFTNLNAPDSDINILLGSRSFYEGWDSNRPNVITYINIGMDEEAKKFILQSVGRGVRIEPIKNQRKRLRELCASGVLPAPEQALLEQIRDDVQALESVFVFGTNHAALDLVIRELDDEDKRTGEQEIALELNHADVDHKLLLIPQYAIEVTPLYQERSLAKFALTPANLELLQRYVEYVDDNRVFYALHETSPEQIGALRASLSHPDETFRTDSEREYKNLPVMVRQALNYFGLHGKEFAEFKVLEDEINHYLHIRISLDKLGDLEQRIQKVLASIEAIKALKERFIAKQISLDEFADEIRNQPECETFLIGNSQLEIRLIANHYYIPILLTDDERIEYIRSVIHIHSEVEFLQKLEIYQQKKDNDFKHYDWWLFSRIDEKLDDISIPYYYPIENRMANFKPDFIFWLKKGNHYQIVFIDPKGTGRAEYEHKVEGYKLLFEENNRAKVFHYQGLTVTVHAYLYTADRQIVADGYRRYWFDTIESVLAELIQELA